MIVTVAPGKALVGFTLVIDGALLNVNPFIRLALPLAQVTVTVTAPAACDGVVVVIVVEFETALPTPALPPKSTVQPLAKFVPVRVTLVPPAVEPLDGFTFVNVGAAATT
jgi:hypothetical protein